MRLSLGFSPCPNDCFMFDAIVHRRIDLEGLEFDVHLDDVETLNRAAFAGKVAITKLSVHAFAHLRRGYVLLDAGAALGRGCGPLLISKRVITDEELASGTPIVAIPGRHTTANFLLGFAFPTLSRRTELVFSDIEPALVAGTCDAGVIIHENRFTYEAKGLRKIADLGEVWEERTGNPIPLGAIAIRRSLPDDVLQAVNRVVARSVAYALAHPQESLAFVRAHSQEMDEDVMYRHIDLYVNDHSVDLGDDGRRAVRHLLEQVPEVDPPRSGDRLFVSG
jgi:1,4-dihydroxy-6-naphthoate synthase